MTHEYTDAWASELLDLIHKLEERIIELESKKRLFIFHIGS